MPQALLAPALGPPVCSLLSSLGSAAHSLGCSSYLVGGAVRDALLGIRSADIDIMVEGELRPFLDALQAQWPSCLPGAPRSRSLFPKFLTAKLFFASEIVPGVAALDFSQARRESYPESGQPPIVAPGDFASDMQRRDFSFNALAMRISPADFGELIDLTGGAEDLASGLVRVLHAASFVDDPVRLLRALRMVTRFDFALAQETEKLFMAGVRGGYLARVPLLRRFDEFRKAVSERSFYQLLLRMEELKLLEQVCSVFRLTPQKRQRLSELAHREGCGNRQWEEVCAILLADAGSEQRRELLAAVRCPRQAAERIEELARQ